MESLPKKADGAGLGRARRAETIEVPPVKAKVEPIAYHEVAILPARQQSSKA